MKITIDTNKLLEALRDRSDELLTSDSAWNPMADISVIMQIVETVSLTTEI